MEIYAHLNSHLFLQEILQDLRAHIRKTLQKSVPVTPSLATRPREDAFLAVMRILEGESNLINKNPFKARLDGAAPSMLPIRCPNFNAKPTELGENKEAEQNACGSEEAGVQLPPLGPYAPLIHNDANVDSALQTKLPEVIGRYDQNWIFQKDAEPCEFDTLENSGLEFPQISTNTAILGGSALIEDRTILASGMSAVLDDASWGVFFS